MIRICIGNKRKRFGTNGRSCRKCDNPARNVRVPWDVAETGTAVTGRALYRSCRECAPFGPNRVEQDRSASHGLQRTAQRRIDAGRRSAALGSLPSERPRPHDKAPHYNADGTRPPSYAGGSRLLHGMTMHAAVPMPGRLYMRTPKSLP